MFDIGFIELLLCAVIALLVLGPERLPVAARAAGRWIGKARRMTRNFTAEMDRQLKADELREKIRKEGSQLGADDIQRNFQAGLDQARKYKGYLVSDESAAPSTGPAAPANATGPAADPVAETEPEYPTRATALYESELDPEPSLSQNQNQNQNKSDATPENVPQPTPQESPHR